MKSFLFLKTVFSIKKVDITANKLPSSPAKNPIVKNSRKVFSCITPLFKPKVFRMAFCFSLCLKLSWIVASIRNNPAIKVSPRISFNAWDTFEIIDWTSEIIASNEIREIVGKFFINSAESDSFSLGTWKEVI